MGKKTDKNPLAGFSELAHFQMEAPMTADARKAGRRSDIDWESCHRDFQIGRLTIAQLAQKYGCAKSSITLKAKKLGWSRDLTESVKVATKAALIEDAKIRAAVIGREIGTESAADTEGAIRAAVSENLSLILGHRDDIKELRDGLKASIQQLNDEAQSTALLAQIALMLESEHPDAVPALYKRLGVSNRIAGYKAAMETLARAIDKEREAFGIDDKSGAKSGVDQAILDAILADKGMALEVD
jgi:hypothetical protein